MAYQMAALAVTFGHSPVVGLFKYNPWNICAAFYTISTDSVLALFLCISRTSCCFMHNSQRASSTHYTAIHSICPPRLVIIQE